MTSDKPVHLNAAGAALPLPAAQEAVLAHMREEARVGPHWAAAAAAEELNEVRIVAGRLLGAADPGHVAFGETATRLWASALGSAPLAPGKRLLLARCEWGGNVLNALKRAREAGASVEIVPSDAAGRLDVGALAAMLDERVAAICLPAVSSGLGVAQPLVEVGRLPRPEGCLLFVDAAQAAGRQPVAMADWRADVVTAPARKWLRGPRGQAVMALSRAALSSLGDPPLLDQAGSAWIGPRAWRTREDATRFETYEFSVAGRLGFGRALAHAEQGLLSIRAGLMRLVDRLHRGLARTPGITVFEDDGDGAAFVTFVRDGERPSDTVGRLRASGVAIATVGLGYARLDLEARGLEEVCRVAPHTYTTPDEIARFLEAVSGMTAAGITTTP